MTWPKKPSHATVPLRKTLRGRFHEELIFCHSISTYRFRLAEHRRWCKTLCHTATKS